MMASGSASRPEGRAYASERMLGHGKMDYWVHGKIPHEREVYTGKKWVTSFQNQYSTIPSFHVDSISQMPLKAE